MKKISVSILASKEPTRDIQRINVSTADFIHVDVGDGKFVENKHNPYRLLDRLSKKYNKRLDVHLMELKPKKNIHKYATLNTEYITIHVELGDVSSYIDQIKKYGIKVGLAINPDTDISTLKPYLDRIDLILIMSVYPGYGGQKFIPETTKRILKIKKMIVSEKRNIKITIDGGVNDETSKELDFADILVSGSYALAGDVTERVEILRNNADKLKKKDRED